MQGHWHSSPDLTDYYVDWESKRFGPGQYSTSISNPVKDPISDGKNGTPRVGSETCSKNITSAIGKEPHKQNTLRGSKGLFYAIRFQYFTDKYLQVFSVPILGSP